ncbi:MAG: hypothetical protein JW878_09525 [Methanomicrobia archaeon]|nr:hypothetical protein [Methanomicrobia archaeon]
MAKEKSRPRVKKVRSACERVNEAFSKISNLEGTVHDGFKKIYKNRPVLTLILAILFFVGVAFFHGYVHVLVADWLHEDPGQQDNIVEDIIEPEKTLYRLTTGDDAYIQIWEPCTSRSAPDKGWLIAENPFYKLSINLDYSYYLIFDKVHDKDILVYDDSVTSEIDMLTGCDLGFGDHNGDNPLHYATTALYDIDGLAYEIAYEDEKRGFVLINTQGWDTRQKEVEKGYDVEAEVMFGIFADKPYFVNAVELTNLQKMGYVYQNPYKDPDEIVQSWVLFDDYRSTCMQGGDNSHGDTWGPPLLYNVTTLSRTERKPWHVGSAAFSKMFPNHIILGDKIGGGIIFSLPDGIFRFDDRLGAYGDQIVGEFIINVDEPQEAITFTVNPVNELLFFYDFLEFNTVDGYKELMESTCEKYGVEYPNETLDAHNWRTKRYAYVITLVDHWYDAETDRVSAEAWTLADQGLADFYVYQERVRTEMEKTTPLASH